MRERHAKIGHSEREGLHFFSAEQILVLSATYFVTLSFLNQTTKQTKHHLPFSHLATHLAGQS